MDSAKRLWGVDNAWKNSVGVNCFYSRCSAFVNATAISVLNQSILAAKVPGFNKTEIADREYWLNK